MPELPDVEYYRTYVEAVALHRPIRAVEILDDRELEEEPSDLGAALEGLEFTAARRHGKHLFLETTGAPVLRLHFGMTGGVEFYKGDENPEHTSVLLSFPENYHLAYMCVRTFGVVDLVSSVDEFVVDAGLGPDALAVDRAQFKHLFEDTRGMVKTRLMNQSLLAGLGTVYSDEILFQAGIHPRTPVADLEEEHLGRLYDTMREVLEVGIAAHASSEGLPDEFLSSNREEGRPCPECAHEIVREVVAGRSAYFCPGHQENAGEH